jgi:hypothetical protein
MRLGVARLPRRIKQPCDQPELYIRQYRYTRQSEQFRQSAQVRHRLRSCTRAARQRPRAAEQARRGGSARPYRSGRVEAWRATAASSGAGYALRGCAFYGGHCRTADRGGRADRDRSKLGSVSAVAAPVLPGTSRASHRMLVSSTPGITHSRPGMTGRLRSLRHFHDREDFCTLFRTKSFVIMKRLVRCRARKSHPLLRAHSPRIPDAFAAGQPVLLRQWRMTRAAAAEIMQVTFRALPWPPANN